MKITKLNNYSRIFFIGIGGISMSGLAKYLLSKNKKVSGSDIHENNLTQELSESGAKIYVGHSKSNIKKNTDLVIYSGAIKPLNPEMVKAKEMQIPLIERSVLLGLVADEFKNVISVSGTHGKTTTTALIGEIFLRANSNPTIHVGGEVVSAYNNFRLGDNDFFITEACEYKKSLEHLNSTVSVVTNIEKDHMDCYVNIDDIYKTFNVFANKTKRAMIVSRNKNILKNITHKNIVTCGNKKSVYEYCNETQDSFGNYAFEVYKEKVCLGKVQLSIRGKYNVNNAMLAIAVADYYGIDFSVIQKALLEFKGVKRRNELMGYAGRIPVFADYAHHPTEIKQSIDSFKKSFDRLLVVFQPHTYSRTVALKREFKKCFSNSDGLVIFKTYPAREEYDILGSEEALYLNLKYKKNKYLIVEYEELNKTLNEISVLYDAILLLGAGDLYEKIKLIPNSFIKQI